MLHIYCFDNVGVRIKIKGKENKLTSRNALWWELHSPVAMVCAAATEQGGATVTSRPFVSYTLVVIAVTQITIMHPATFQSYLL